MNTASRGVRSVLETFSEEPVVEHALLKFVRQLEHDYEEVQDINLFIFALRTFFCWHRASELLEAPYIIPRIQRLWLDQNEDIYTKWLTSVNDDHEPLKWFKWTFQAKNTILTEFMQGLKKTA
jgi:hypothetical protein